MKLIQIIAGILLPPLGIFLSVGVGPTLLINILLTLLGWVPGSIHAVWVIVKHQERLVQEDTINKQPGIYQ